MSSFYCTICPSGEGGGDDDSSKMIRMNEDKDDIQAKEIGMKMKMAKMFELQ